jgi:hypothetical protein
MYDYYAELMRLQGDFSHMVCGQAIFRPEK